MTGRRKWLKLGKMKKTDKYTKFGKQFNKTVKALDVTYYWSKFSPF